MGIPVLQIEAYTTMPASKIILLKSYLEGELNLIDSYLILQSLFRDIR